MIEVFVTETTFEYRKDGQTVLFLQRGSQEFAALQGFLCQQGLLNGNLNVTTTERTGHPCGPKPG